MYRYALMNPGALRMGLSKFWQLRLLPRDLDLPGSAMIVEAAIEWCASLAAQLKYQNHLSAVSHSAHRVDAILTNNLQCSESDLIELLTYEVLGNTAAVPRALIPCVGYLRALDTGLANATSNPNTAFSASSVQALHRDLTKKMAIKGAAGEFRKSLDHGSSFGPSSESPSDAVMGYMDDVEDFIHCRAPIPFVVRLALVYGQIEMIQPFDYGSIYIAQIMVQSMMVSEGYPQIPISGIMVRDKKDAFSILVKAKESGHWEGWVSRFLTCLSISAKVFCSLLEAIDSVNNKWKSILDHVRRDSAAIKISNILLSHPVVTVSHIQRSLGISFQTANAGLHTLVDCQILTVAKAGKSKKRNRVFVAKDIIQCLHVYAASLSAERYDPDGRRLSESPSANRTYARWRCG